MIIQVNVPEFKKGQLYFIKALDHFTMYKGRSDQLFLEMIGYYVGETDFYFQFACLFYEETTSNPNFYTPEIKNILKVAIFEFDVINYKETLIEINNDIGGDIHCE